MYATYKIPVCNIIACEDIFIKNGAKLYIYNPFTAISGRNIKSFYTYSIIQEIPNGYMTFKAQIISPSGKVIKETEENTVEVGENVLRIKTQWSNISFFECGEHMIVVLMKCNNDFDIVGSSYLIVL